MHAPEILSALTTPFDDAGEIDHAAFAANVARLTGVVDGVFVNGTTGEFPAVTTAEHAALTEAALAAFGPDRVVVHVGSPSTRTSLELTRAAAALGATRFAALTPYYLAASSQGIVAHWSALKDACGGELYGYVFPDVAVTDLLPESLPDVLASGIDGLKTSATASTRVTAYLAQAPAGFKLWSGNDADLPAVLAAGGTGTVSGVSGALPLPWARYRDAVAAGDTAAADAAQAVIAQIVPVLGPSIANLKFALDLQGLGGGRCRMSIDEPTPETQQRIREAVALAS